MLLSHKVWRSPKVAVKHQSLTLRVVVTVLECCVTFSGVKLSIRSFVLLLFISVTKIIYVRWYHSHSIGFNPKFLVRKNEQIPRG